MTASLEKFYIWVLGWRELPCYSLIIPSSHLLLPLRTFHYPHVTNPWKMAPVTGNGCLSYTEFSLSLTSVVTSDYGGILCGSMLSIALQHTLLREKLSLLTPPATTIFPSGQELAFYPLSSVCPFTLSNGGLMLLISHVGWYRDQLINVCKELHY